MLERWKRTLSASANRCLPCKGKECINIHFPVTDSSHFCLLPAFLPTSKSAASPGYFVVSVTLLPFQSSVISVQVLPTTAWTQVHYGLHTIVWAVEDPFCPSSCLVQPSSSLPPGHLSNRQTELRVSSRVLLGTWLQGWVCSLPVALGSCSLTGSSLCYCSTPPWWVLIAITPLVGQVLAMLDLLVLLLSWQKSLRGINSSFSDSPSRVHCTKWTPHCVPPPHSLQSAAALCRVPPVVSPRLNKGSATWGEWMNSWMDEWIRNSTAL